MYEKNQAQQKWLESFIAQHDGIAGTVHVQRGVPPNVIAIVAHVPHGKGMAGVPGEKGAGANLQLANRRYR